MRWNTKTRIFLTKYLGVVTNIFTSNLSRKILCAPLVPVFELGVKFNFVMILEGKQGKVIDQYEKNEHLNKTESCIKTTGLKFFEYQTKSSRHISNQTGLFFSSLSLLNDIGGVTTKRFQMTEDPDNPNTKRYKTEFIVIIALMVIVAAFIVVQVMPKL